MRRLLLFSCSLCLAVLAGACNPDTGGSQETGTSTSSSSEAPARSGQTYDTDAQPVPDLTLETMKGTSIDLAEQDGNVLLLNFWATWCAPCRKEIPDLKALQSDLGPKGLTIVGIALDREGTEVVKPFVEQHSINYPIVVDAEGTTESELGPIPGLPTTLVVDPNGSIVRRVVGIFPTEQMKPTLEEMLATGEQDAEST